MFTIVFTYQGACPVTCCQQFLIARYRPNRFRSRKGCLPGSLFILCRTVMRYRDSFRIPGINARPLRRYRRCSDRDRFRLISTIAGTINVPHAKPSISPVINRDACVFSHIPKIPSDQSTAIGIIERNSQNLAGGSTSFTSRHSGYIANPRNKPKYTPKHREQTPNWCPSM